LVVLRRKFYKCTNKTEFSKQQRNHSSISPSSNSDCLVASESIKYIKVHIWPQS
jgi:hypothetical protein